MESLTCRKIVSSREDAGMNSRSHQLRSVEIGDSPKSWTAAGFTVTDGAVTIGSTTIKLAAGAPPGILRIGVDDIDGPIDGMPFGPGEAAADGSPGHANHVVAIDHLVATSPDLDRTTAALQSADIELRRERHFGDGADAKRQAFFWLGDVILELVGPAAARPHGQAVLWGLAFTCDDLDTAKNHLGDMLSDPIAAVQRGRRIATLRTAELDISVPVALMSPHLAG
jgi:hypothetical protein